MRPSLAVSILLMLLIVLCAMQQTHGRKKTLKMKKYFGGKKKKHQKEHQKKHDTTTSIKPISPTSLTLIDPTAATFAASAIQTAFTATPVLITITDRNYNYFYGYPTSIAGVNYYQSPRFLVAGPRRCGCCDSHPIIFTRTNDHAV